MSEIVYLSVKFRKSVVVASSMLTSVTISHRLHIILPQVPGIRLVRFLDRIAGVHDQQQVGRARPRVGQQRDRHITADGT